MSSDMPIITTKHNVLDILKHPEDFIDEYSDTEIMTLLVLTRTAGITLSWKMMIPQRIFIRRTKKPLWKPS